MHSPSLTLQQLRRLQFAVRRHAAYFAALSGRIDQKYFPRDDPLRIAADDVNEAVKKLEAEVAQLVRRSQELERGSSPY